MHRRGHVRFLHEILSVKRRQCRSIDQKLIQIPEEVASIEHVRPPVVQTMGVKQTLLRPEFVFVERLLWRRKGQLNTMRVNRDLRQNSEVQVQTIAAGLHGMRGVYEQHIARPYAARRKIPLKRLRMFMVQIDFERLRPRHGNRLDADGCAGILHLQLSLSSSASYVNQ